MLEENTQHHPGEHACRHAHTCMANIQTHTEARMNAQCTCMCSRPHHSIDIIKQNKIFGYRSPVNAYCLASVGSQLSILLDIILYYKSRRSQYPGENTWSYLWFTRGSIPLMLMVRGQVELVPLTPEALIGSKPSSVFLATLKASVFRKTSNIWVVFCSDLPTKRLGICRLIFCRSRTSGRS